MRCEICKIDCGYYDGIIYSRDLEQQRSFIQEFWAQKGVKKNTNDTFDACVKCFDDYKNYFSEAVVSELNHKNIIEITDFYPTFFSKDDFGSEENYKRFQSALAENIKCRSKKWKIIEVNFLDNDKIKRRYTILVHQSVRLEYEGDLLNEKCFDGRRIFWKHHFPVSVEQWNEIEAKINSEQNKASTKNNDITLKSIFGSGIIVFIFLIFIVMVRMKRIKNKKI